MSKVRVCHFIEATGGGVLSVVLDMLRVLNTEWPEKYEFTVVYSRRPETPSNLEEMFPGVRLVEVSLQRSMLSFKDVKAVLSLRSFFLGFDAVHLHSSKAGLIGRVSLVFNRKVRVFYSPHCYAFLCEEFSRGKRRLIYLAEAILSRFFRCTTVSCGDSEYRISLKLGGRSVMIRNGIEDRGRSRFGFNNKGLVSVVGSGRNSLQKDPLFFSQISALLCSSRFSFKWIGEHPVAELGTGWISREQAVSLMTSADIFLATSRWEGLPVAGVEALSLGKPLLVRRCCGFNDLVVHGVNGFIFDSPEEAAKILTDLGEDRERLAALGEQSRKLFEEKFSDRNYRALDALYGS